MNGFLNWFETMPLAGTTAIAATLAAVLSLASLRVRRWGVRLAVALFGPFLISYCLYWLPVWMGEDPSEYGAWAFIIFVPWGAAGVMASLAVLGASYVWAHRADLG